ncbi:MAG: dihydroneopterin aldolase [Holosporaceae bacterium]|jgi:dihydroneopterin aldolase|nr:dihydroneopterin aldolase [Holosporaceae bacterium]
MTHQNIAVRQLNINHHQTYFILGNEALEKLEKRRVIINVSLRFPEKNLACHSDNLADTVCCSELVELMEQKLKGRKFNLVERVAQFLYEEISIFLKNDDILKRVEVIKPAPPVKNVESVSFCCSDW